MLAALVFAFPMVLAACGAVAAPVIIHLIMRTRPRPMVFPALRFVRKTHHANLSKLRLKQLILLLMRMAIIALIALLIARGMIPNWRTASPPAAPTALAVVVDNSGSMGYLREGKTLLERGKRVAVRMLDSLHQQSQVAVFSVSDPKRSAVFLSDRKVTAQQIWDVEATDGHWTLGPAVAEAVAAVQSNPIEQKQVYVITDLTAQAWRDRPSLRGSDNVRFILVNCMTGEDVNMSLGPLRLSSQTPAVSAAVRVETDIYSARIGDQVKLRVELDGREVHEESHRVLPGASTPVSLVVSPRRGGAVHGRVILDYDDPLSMDNVRYFTLQVAGSRRMLILRDPATMGRGDQTSLLMSNAISPSVGGAREQWLQKVTVSADRLTKEHLDKVDMVLMPNISSLTATQWQTLEEYVYDGGRLWIVAGPLMSAPAYSTADAQCLMPAVPRSREELPSPMGWQRSGDVHPMLQPFSTDENPPLSNVLCRRRMSIERVVPGAQVIVRYDDSVPAIAMRKVGRGLVLFWNFSPAQGLSNMTAPGQQEILPIMARRAAKVLMSQTQADTMYPLGQSITIQLPRGMPTATVMLTMGGEGQKKSRRITPDLKLSSVTLTPDSVGNWNLDFSGSSPATAEADTPPRYGLSVNAVHAESDMTPAGRPQLQKMFPPDRMTVVDDAEALQTSPDSPIVSLDLAIPIILSLLTLMIGESFFANRFYRRGAAIAEDQPPTR